MYSDIMWLVNGSLAGANIGMLSVLIGKQWIFMPNDQRLRFVTLWAFCLTWFVAATARGVGHEIFIGRYYIGLTANLLCVVTNFLSLYYSDRTVAALRLAKQVKLDKDMAIRLLKELDLLERSDADEKIEL